MKTVALVFGTRPEAIKLAPVERLLRGSTRLSCRVCVTAQHREMLDQVLRAFDIRIDADLDVMRADQSLPELTGRLVVAIDRWLASEPPDLVLVQGDTTTAFCATLAAFYHRIPVGHVEAGLRTGDLYSPWPEEGNRALISRLARWHFAPTSRARENLLREGVPEKAIIVTGNTAVDAIIAASERVRHSPPDIPGVPQTILSDDAPLVLVTGHRRENFGPGLARVCEAIATLARRLPHVHFVYPVHPNPNVSDPVRRILPTEHLKNIHLIRPLEYLPFVRMMVRSTVILTDSGGIQEEAPSLGKPVLVTREITERPEAVEAGNAVLVGTDAARIVAEVERLISQPSARAAMLTRSNPFGDGRAAERIVQACLR
jgi:UDP-N-acetylglucosamine 2-epimerase (non-hydrolysing)